MAIYPEFKNKVILLTGGSNGIGWEMARSFSKSGAFVHYCDLEKPRRKLKAEFTKVDLRSEQEIVSWINGIKQRRRKIDVVINNAAIDPRVSLGKITVAEWQRQFETNVRSMFLVCREAVPAIPRGGSIINLGSITFHAGPVDMSTYVATKGAIIAFTRGLSRELGPKGIRVNTLSPGWIMTERQLEQYVTPAVRKLIRERQAIPDLITPEEIARVALFLASDDASAITGQELLADRGWHHS